jgi:hypothetical protein
LATLILRSASGVSDHQGHTGSQFIDEVNLQRPTGLLVELQPRDGQPQVLRHFVERLQAKLVRFVRIFSYICAGSITRNGASFVCTHTTDTAPSSSPSWNSLMEASKDCLHLPSTQLCLDWEEYNPLNRGVSADAALRKFLS